MRKKIVAPFALGIVSLLFLAGCATDIKTAVYPNADFLPTVPEQVQILKHFPPDPTAYQVIGEVSVPRMDHETSRSFERELRKKIAGVGGHAVVLYKNLESTEAIIGFPNGGAASVRTSQNSGVNVGVPSVTIPNPPPSQVTGQTVLPSFSMNQSFSGRGYILRYR